MKMNLISIIKKIVAPELLALYKRMNASDQTKQLEELMKLPRFNETTFNFKGVELRMPDAASFRFMFKEIFKQEIYKFRSQNRKPFIIDAGANIGLSLIYFKSIYPESEIIAFEPDNSIFNYLQKNISQFNYKDVQLIKKGLWDKETLLAFNSEGADGGSIIHAKSNNNIELSNSEISVVSLNTYLTKSVDFLKMDIEGTELKVLKDIEKNLNLVQRIFVEYHSFIGEEQCLSDILEILKRAGFRIYTSNPGNISIPSPLLGYGNYNNMDFQLNIFGVRIKE
jgi:FkbM family methyltransferase